MHFFRRKYYILTVRSKISIWLYPHLIWLSLFTLPQIWCISKVTNIVHSCFLFLLAVIHNRECGWRTSELAPTCLDPCAVCLERQCMVAVEGRHIKLTNKYLLFNWVYCLDALTWKMIWPSRCLHFCCVTIAMLWKHDVTNYQTSHAKAIFSKWSIYNI